MTYALWSVYALFSDLQILPQMPEVKTKEKVYLF